MHTLQQKASEAQGPGVLLVAKEPGVKVETQIIQRCKILGVSGFAVTRGVEDDYPFVVSCTKTGFRFPRGSTESAVEAIKLAEGSLRLLSAERGQSPAKIMEWTRRKARAVFAGKEPINA